MLGSIKDFFDLFLGVNFPFPLLYEALLSHNEAKFSQVPVFSFYFQQFSSYFSSFLSDLWILKSDYADDLFVF